MLRSIAEVLVSLVAGTLIALMVAGGGVVAEQGSTVSTVGRSLDINPDVAFTWCRD